MGDLHTWTWYLDWRLGKSVRAGRFAAGLSRRSFWMPALSGAALFKSEEVVLSVNKSSSQCELCTCEVPCKLNDRYLKTLESMFYSRDI